MAEQETLVTINGDGQVNGETETTEVSATETENNTTSKAELASDKDLLSPHKRKDNNTTVNSKQEEQVVSESTMDDKPTVSLESHQKLMEERDQYKMEIQTLKDKEKMNQEITSQLKEKYFAQLEKLEKLEVRVVEGKEALESCQAELNKKLKELSDSHNSQETIMGRVIVLDQERMKLLDEQVGLERKQKDLSKENDRLQSLLKIQKTEINKLTASKDKNDSKISEQATELKKVSDELSSVNIKLKWAQNKLKTETEGHKTVKAELATTVKKLKVAKEESEQIRKDMKKMIAEYQNSEEMKSNTLDSQLKKKEEELKQQEQEIADQTQLHDLTVKELQLLRESLEISQQECSGLKNRVSELTSQITEKQAELDEVKTTLTKEKRDQKKLNSEIDSMKEMNKDIETERQSFSALKETHAHLQKVSQHLEREISRRKDKEAELLGFSEKLSSSNAELKADKDSLETQVNQLEQQWKETTDELQSTKTRKEELETELSELKAETEVERSLAMDQLHSKSVAVEQLTLSLEEEREQIKALKRKHASNIKDMQRQIQLYSKQIERLETSTQSSAGVVPTLQVDSTSNSSAVNMGIRTMSHGSLDGSTGNLHIATYPNNHNRMSSPDDGSPTVKVQNSMFETLDQEKTVLVEKICSLNKALARRDERIEFFEGHASQLTDDLKKKSRIIQSYVLRDDSGVLAPPEVDAHKERFRKKSGIMASVFSGSAQKGSPEMTLEMSLEINRKMQAVLEDTLLKNITLKESLDTLGQEIARLSKQLNSYRKPSPILPKR